MFCVGVNSIARDKPISEFSLLLGLSTLKSDTAFWFPPPVLIGLSLLIAVGRGGGGTGGSIPQPKIKLYIKPPATKSSVIDIASKPNYFPDTSQTKGLRPYSLQVVGPLALLPLF